MAMAPGVCKRSIEGLITTKPVPDENVLYSFTFYDPFLLTMQGAKWFAPAWWSHLAGVPYPSSPEIIRERLPALLEKINPSPPPRKRNWPWWPGSAGAMNTGAGSFTSA